MTFFQENIIDNQHFKSDKKTLLDLKYLVSRLQHYFFFLVLTIVVLTIFLTKEY